MKKVLAITAILLFLGSQSAEAATKVKVVNSKKISAKNGLITLTLTNLPKTNGIHISQCMAIEEGKKSLQLAIPQRLQNYGFQMFRQISRWVRHQAKVS